MKANVGGADKVIRYILGIAILIVGYVYHSWWGLVGFVPILTATISWCPLYAPFGISTKRKEE